MLGKPCLQLFLSRDGQLPSDTARSIQTSAAERPAGVSGPESPGRGGNGWRLHARWRGNV